MDKISERIVYAIIEDMTKHIRLEDAWFGLPPATRANLKAEWSAIVIRELAR